MKYKQLLLPALASAMAVQVASAQEITAKWYQHINGTVGVAEADRLPILKKQGTPSENLDGTDQMDAYRNLIRYDATRLLLGVGENGINESDPNLSAADKALAEAYPDRSLIWLDAATGKPLGVAFKESFRPDLLAGKDVTGAAGQGSSYAWWRVAIDQGPDGQRAIYSAFKNLILRYAPKAGGGWESTPTVAYEEQVGGVGDGLSNGDGSTSWRFRDFHVRGSGANTVIYAGGGTWRAGHHPQVLVTTDGLNFTPKARVDNRDNGARRNDYALGGLSSFPTEYPNTYGGDPNNPKISVVFAGHFPGTGWEARPNRYASNPDNPVPSPAYNAQPNVVVYTRNETAFAGLTAFNWEAAGKDGRPLDYNVDGTTRYDGNWNGALATDPGLDYIVAYSMPSWNNVLPKIDPTADDPTPRFQTPAWLAIHRLDGSIASGSSSFKLDFRENDEPIEDQQTAGNAGGPVGHDYLYDPWIELVPDPSVPGKAEALVTFGSAGFGVFTIQNVGATLVSSPAAQTVAAGTDVVLTANVTGSPNAFQWYKDGKPLAEGPQYLGTTRKVSLTIKSVTGRDDGLYSLRWSNPISGPGQTLAAKLTVNGEAVRLASVQIQPETLPVVIPAGSVTATGDDTFTVAGPGLKAYTSASDADQPGDVQEFAYESITGDFDKIVKITSITSGPVTDPVDALASGGLQARVSTNPVSPSFLISAANPLGANDVRVTGRAIEGQNYTIYGRLYSGVGANLPNQWVRLRRVGDYFAAYVGTNGVDWALVGQRYQQWPATLLVGTFAFSASYTVVDGTGSGGENLATVEYSNYGNAPFVDFDQPTIVSVGTTDKKTVGVKFSRSVNSASALIPLNYKLSQGTVTGVRMGIGGDSVYLTVTGLTDDTFTVTVLGGVTDSAGNAIAANSSATGKASNWVSQDVGLIQDPANRPTPGDDPYRVGQAVAVSSGEGETEIEIVGGGSNAWNPGDYVHYLSSATPLKGDFEVTVEISRNDRPANTAGWANSGLMLRQSAYLTGAEFTADGTKVPMVANTTYIENSGPNRAGIPLWREEAGGGYGNGNAGFQWTTPINGIKGYYLGQRAIDAAGTPDPESSALSSRWLRIKRTGSAYLFYVSYDGIEWAALDEAPKELPLGDNLLFGFSTMNDTGANAPPGNAYAGNGEVGTPLEGNQNASNYSVQRIRIGTNVSPRPPVGPATISIQGSVITYTGVLTSSDSVGGPYTPVAGASSPYTVPAGTTQKFYRSAN